MVLPVLSLSSLASREVLGQDLDTRELPRHLHREMEDYRRLEGAFSLREVDFEVARDGAVSQEEREEAWQWFLKSDVGKTMMEFEVVVRRPSENSWSVSWAGEHKDTTLHLKNPVDILHGIIMRKYHFMAQHYINIHTANYLENGKVVFMSKFVEHRAKFGMTVFKEETSSFKIDESDWLTMVQRLGKPLQGLTYISTIRAPRAQRRGDREVFFDYKEEWTKSGLLNLALRARKDN